MVNKVKRMKVKEEETFPTLTNSMFSLPEIPPHHQKQAEESGKYYLYTWKCFKRSGNHVYDMWKQRVNDRWWVWYIDSACSKHMLVTLDDRYTYTSKGS